GDRRAERHRDQHHRDARHAGQEPALLDELAPPLADVPGPAQAFEERHAQQPGLVERPPDAPARQVRGLGKAEGHQPPTSPGGTGSPEDRKSTRLNSSHVKISYAVFCLTKKQSWILTNARPYSVGRATTCSCSRISTG